MTRCWVGLLAVLAVVGTAAAEPIRWSYSGTGNTILRGSDGESVEGAGFIHPSVGLVDPSQWDDEGQYTGISSVSLAITDSASGEVRTLNVPYSIFTGVSYIEAEPGVFADFTLGANRYTLSAAGSLEYSGWLYVEPTPAAAETPEPGTLILGGIALAGGVGAWWRKRRK
jgi:hypothetical protein